jgi:hypothetical protein
VIQYVCPIYPDTFLIEWSCLPQEYRVDIAAATSSKNKKTRRRRALHMRARAYGTKQHGVPNQLMTLGQQRKARAKRTKACNKFKREHPGEDVPAHLLPSKPEPTMPRTKCMSAADEKKHRAADAARAYDTTYQRLPWGTNIQPWGKQQIAQRNPRACSSKDSVADAAAKLDLVMALTPDESKQLSAKMAGDGSLAKIDMSPEEIADMINQLDLAETRQAIQDIKTELCQVKAE